MSLRSSGASGSGQRGPHCMNSWAGYRCSCYGLFAANLAAAVEISASRVRTGIQDEERLDSGSSADSTLGRRRRRRRRRDLATRCANSRLPGHSLAQPSLIFASTMPRPRNFPRSCADSGRCQREGEQSGRPSFDDFTGRIFLFRDRLAHFG